MTDYRDNLREIKTFPSLVKFLRSELDWPIETDDFEDLTYLWSRNASDGDNGSRRHATDKIGLVLDPPQQA